MFLSCPFCVQVHMLTFSSDLDYFAIGCNNVSVVTCVCMPVMGTVLLICAAGEHRHPWTTGEVLPRVII